MGKRMTAALAVLMCLFALAACGSQQQDVYETSDVQAMVDAGAFSVALEEVDGDTAFQLCGLSSAGLNREDMTMPAGTTFQLKVSGTSSAVSWSMADTSIATIDADGTVHFLKKGTTTATATVDGQSLQCIVRVS